MQSILVLVATKPFPSKFDHGFPITPDEEEGDSSERISHNDMSPRYAAASMSAPS